MEEFLCQAQRGGRAALGLWCSVGNVLIAEMVASLGADYVCLDMQHGGTHSGNLVSMLQAVGVGGSVPIVRVADGSPVRIMEALDAGARGVVVPCIETCEEAMRAVEACRFPPRGNRSFGPYRASIFAESADPRELEQVSCIVMIETAGALDNLEEILSIEGLTAVYIGPTDLSLAMGLPPGSVNASEFKSVCDDVLGACIAHGVVAGLHCYDGVSARRAVEQGFGMVTVAGELRLLRAALVRELREVGR